MLPFLVANSKLPFIALHEASPLASSEQIASQVFFSLSLGFALILICTFYALWKGTLGKQEKKILFGLIAIGFILPTMYMIALIIGHNINSVTGGPIHWHADFDVFACGEQLEPEMAKGWTTRVGSLLLHHHGDRRMHIEGVVVDYEQINLHHFFESIGGTLESNTFSMRVEGEGLRTFKNGDLCPDGKVGTVRVFKKNWDTGEFEPIPDFPNYVVAHATDIPPGDYLKIVFGA